MAPNTAATAYELAWGDGTVPTWMVGNTLAFLLFYPLLKALFPKSMKKQGAFLGAFELTCFIPVRLTAPAPHSLGVSVHATPPGDRHTTPVCQCGSELVWPPPLRTVCGQPCTASTS